ncbi:hypothetical protein R3P38DRAFT_152526 [Favolaschia claudopus]|uniref:Uncharacterized protein n=1 Tax=Favolaschia claudopus TaxID=2862362 RepID=A0AAV9ZVS1_9AGAR
MPVTRHVRREGRTSYNPLALPSLPSIPSFFSFSSSNKPDPQSSSAASIAPSATSSTTLTPSFSSFFSSSSTTTLNHASSPPPPLPHPFSTSSSTTTTEAGHSTSTTPFFLRRSKTARRVDDFVQRGLDSSRLLQDICESMDLEAVQIVASSCVLLFDTVQTVRTNRTQTRMLLERVHQIVRALINLCGDARSRSVGLAPGMAMAIERLTETLTGLHTLLQTHASAPLLSRILKSAGMKDELAQCDDELGAALALFEVKTDLLTHVALGSAVKRAKERHEELVRALRAKGFGAGGGG